MRLRIQLCTILAISVFPCLGHAQDPPFSDKSPAALLEVLTSDADTFAKAKACQRLAIVGDEAATDALLGLLDDPQLNVYALTALQQIPGDRVDAALLFALEAHQGRNRVGIIHAIGERKLTTAEPQLVRLYQDEEATPEERQAAIRALGKLGATDRLRPKHAQNLLEKRIIADAILVAKAAGVENSASTFAWDEAFRATSESDFRRSLARLRNAELSHDTLHQVLSALPGLTGTRQVLLINAIAAHSNAGNIKPDLELMAPLIKASDSENIDVAKTALERLAAWGHYDQATSLPNWVDQRPELARVALGALALSANKSFDEQVLHRLQRLIASESSSSLANQTLGMIDYAAERRLSAATPQLLALARQGAAAVAAAAIEAAGYTVSLAQFESFLTQLVGSADAAYDSTAADTAMARATVRLPRRDAAKVIGEMIPRVDQPTKIWLLTQLPALGGEKALQVAVDAARSGEDALMDGATRALGEWLSADVAKPLGELAESLPPGNYRTRALRAYLRVGRQFDLPDAERLQLCRRGLQLSQRDDERLLVIDILKRNPTIEAGEILVEIANSPHYSRMLKNQSLIGLAAVTDKHAESDSAEMRSLLQRVDFTNAPESIRRQLQDTLAN